MINKPYPMELFSNHYDLELDPKMGKFIFQYKIVIEPELPGDSRQHRGQIFRNLWEKIKNVLGNFVFTGAMIWAIM